MGDEKQPRFTEYVKCGICGHEFPEQMEKCPHCQGITEQQRADMRMTDADREEALRRAMMSLLEVRNSVFDDPKRKKIKALANHALDVCTKIAEALKEVSGAS